MGNQAAAKGLRTGQEPWYASAKKAIVDYSSCNSGCRNFRKRITLVDTGKDYSIIPKKAFMQAPQDSTWYQRSRVI